jgi:hypothetical protein
MLRSLYIIVVGSHSGKFSMKPNTVHVERIRIALLDVLFATIDGFESQASRWRDHSTGNAFDGLPGWVEDVTYKKLRSILPDHKIKFGQFIPSECENFVDITKVKEFKAIV